MSGRVTGRRSAMVAVAVMVVALVAASCGSGTSSTASSTSTAASSGAAAGPVSKTLGQGVTAKSIRIGFVLIDYRTVVQFIHNTAGDQVQTYQVFVNDLNKHGGVLGRKIIPYFETYAPIGTAGPLAACAALTEDKKVFATIGVMYDATGAGSALLRESTQVDSDHAPVDPGAAESGDDARFAA